MAKFDPLSLFPWCLNAEFVKVLEFLQKVTGMVKFRVHSNVREHRTTFSVKLEGQGHLPEITILRPPPVNPVNPTLAVLDFGNCTLDCNTEANITFKNTGKIVCTV